MTSTTRQVRTVAVLGANGAMGSGGGELFAADGIETVFLARDHEKAREGLERAQTMAKSEKLADFVRLGTYEHDLPKAVAEADLIFEALAEDLELKQDVLRVVDRHRRPDSIVATVSSGLSIAAMCEGTERGLSAELSRHPLLQPAERDRRQRADPARRDRPGGRRLRHRTTRETARPRGRRDRRPPGLRRQPRRLQGAERGRAARRRSTALRSWTTSIGPYTGRAMPPLATVDLVGWDVHRAIVDNLYANTQRRGPRRFRAARVHGEAHRRGPPRQQDAEARRLLPPRQRRQDDRDLVLDPKSGDYRAPHDPIVDAARLRRRR